jgi:hypothetical protein
MGYVSGKNEEGAAMRLEPHEVADLLSRYPGVSGAEEQQILTFLRRGRHIDVGLLTSNDRLRPKLDAFFKDHKAHFRLKWIEGAAAVSGIAALLAIFWLVWESFS